MISPAQIGQLRLSSLFGSASDKGALLGSRPEPVYNYTYDQAVSRRSNRDVKSPAEEAAIMAAINAGPSAESQFGPQRPQLLPDFRGSLIDSANLKDATGMPDTRGPNVPGNRPPTPTDPYKGTRFEGFTGLGNDGYGSMSQGPMDNILADGFFVNDPRRPGVVGDLLPNVVKDPNPINTYMGRPTNMTTAAEIENFEAINNPNPMGEGSGALMVPDAIAGISNQPGGGEVSPPVSAGPDISPQPDMTQRPMPFSGLASLTKLPMFQDFATKLEAEHPEASQLFSQMFMGSSQRPMPYQNPFMGMGMGSFHPMMGMGMGGYNPMMGMGGGFNPMMGGYSPFMGMNPMMGGGFNPMMGMGGGGLGSFYPQPSTYGPPQSMPSMGGYPTPPQSSPFGGAMRGYYA